MGYIPGRADGHSSDRCGKVLKGEAISISPAFRSCDGSRRQPECVDHCCEGRIEGAQAALSGVIAKARYWEKLRDVHCGTSSSSSSMEFSCATRPVGAAPAIRSPACNRVGRPAVDETQRC